MRIAQVAPLHESVPPKLYGGTERIVAYLCESLVSKGHDVTLFASGDSLSSAKLIPCCPEALRLSKIEHDPTISHFIQLSHLTQHIDRFDLVHFHLDYFHFPFSLRGGFKHLTTLHGRLDRPHLRDLFHAYDQVPLVSISNSQREPVLEANWLGTVYHGLPETLYKAQTGKPGQYLCFVGRLSREKRLDRAVQIARNTGLPLKVAAKIDPTDPEYYKNEILPLLADPLVEFVGEVDERQKQELLTEALCLLFPIDWPEPFGLVMIEAMACGTPVIGFKNGAVPEVIEDGVTGYVVDSVAEATRRVLDIGSLDRARCREQFVKRFSADRMTDDYLNLYQELLRDDVTQLKSASAFQFESNAWKH